MTLSDLRRAAGKSQTEVAEACGVSQTAYSLWERGEVSPLVSKLPLLGAALGVDNNTLVAALTANAKEAG